MTNHMENRMLNTNCGTLSGTMTTSGGTTNGWDNTVTYVQPNYSLNWWPNYSYPYYVAAPDPEVAVLRGKVETLEKMVVALLSGRRPAAKRKRTK